MRTLLLWLGFVVYFVIGYWIAAVQTLVSRNAFGTFVNWTGFAFAFLVFLRRAWKSRPKPPPPKPFEHPDFGAVSWDAEEESWFLLARPDGQTFSIFIMGEHPPDEGRLQSARELSRDAVPFLERVRALIAEAPAEPEDEAEIRGLQVESVSFPWPDRPRDALVYFKMSGIDDRVWRCNLTDGVLGDLGFDD